MEIGHIIPHIEALVFASDKPLTPIDITELINNAFGFMDDKVTMEQVQAAMEGIVEKYRSEFYPFEMRESGGGWQFLTKKNYHKTVAQLNGEKFLKRLSAAALETLAIIAYKQPITKSEIESIRGVNCDYSIQKLLEKELIVISGRNEELPGKPLIYNTSKSFMDYFGINSPDDLPKLKEVFDDNMVLATAVSPAETGETEPAGQTPEETGTTEASDGDGNLVVTENGELSEGSTEHFSDEDPEPDPSSAAPEADLPESDLPESDIPEADLAEGDPSSAVSEAGLPEVDPPDSDLSESDIPQSDIPEADLPEADPSEADHPEPDTLETGLPEADPSEADTLEAETTEEGDQEQEDGDADETDQANETDQTDQKEED